MVSYAFYITWNPTYLLLLIATTLLTYCISLNFERVKDGIGKNLILILGIVPILSVLTFFKLQGHWSGLLLPLGISYYAFKLISYLLETYWDHEKIEKNFINFALYPAFAPQIVSGPIQRPDDFFTQLRRAKVDKANPKQIEDAFRLILKGLMLKLLIGDRLASFIDIVDKAPEAYCRRVILATVLCYTVQLYADFSGYTNIAVGIGKLFGINAPPNFNAPFSAYNIQEFWRRWHMTLTSWLTDYVFTPLRMATRNFGGFSLPISVMVTMTLIGLWHGITWPFFMFGLFQGFYVLISTLTLKRYDRFFTSMPQFVKQLRIGFGVCFTYLMMSISIVFWHAPTLDNALLHFKLLLKILPPGTLHFTDIRTEVVQPILPCFIIAFYYGAGAPGVKLVRKVVDSYIPNWVQLGFCLFLLSALTITEGSKFIYGQF
jgi:D-alanyl-lipoteichoic acid acyltransferase DltB (MBOAT superfamily)